MFNDKPSWVRKGAVMDLDFKNMRYWGGYVSLGFAFPAERMKSLLSESNGGGAAGLYMAPDGDGVLQEFPQFALRITRGKGLWVENQATNYALWCRDLTNAVWTLVTATTTKTSIPGATGGQISSATVGSGGSGYVVGDLINLGSGGQLKVATLSGSAVATVTVSDKGRYRVTPANPVAQSTTSGAGTGATFNITWSGTGSRLTASSPLATCLQTITLASSLVIGSAYVKRVTGTGTVSMTIDGTTYTDITSQLNSNTFTVVSVAAQTIINPVIGFQLATSGDVIDVDCVQLEKCLDGVSAYTTPIITTTATLTRGQEEAFFNNPSVSDGYNDGWRWVQDVMYKTPSSCALTVTGNGVAGCLLTGTDVGGYFITGGASGGTVAGASGGVYGLGNLNNIAFSQRSGDKIARVNGGTANVSAGAFSNTKPSHGGLGNNGSGTIGVNGYFERATYWARELALHEVMNYGT